MIDTLTAFIAMSSSSQNGDQPSLIGSLIPFVLIFGVFYFLLIAPARKKQKKHQTMVDSLKNGDKVVTNGGLHGTVVGVSPDVVQLKIADQVRIDVSRNAIAVVQGDAS
jgi:preprotein translocase subunit YajC